MDNNVYAVFVTKGAGLPELLVETRDAAKYAAAKAWALANGYEIHSEYLPGENLGAPDFKGAINRI